MEKMPGNGVDFWHYSSDSQGYTHREIMVKRDIAKGTVSNDLAYIRKQAQDNLQYHIHEVVPEYYQKCLWGMK